MAKEKYTEPKSFFPKDIRKEFKLGEYAEPEKKPKEENKGVTNEDFRRYLKGEK